MRKTPRPPPVFEPGPRLRPAAELLRWLDAAQGSAHLRLPIVIRPRGLTSDAFLAGSPAELDDSSLQLDLDDHRLGISLATRLQSLSSDDDGCFSLWLEGYWGLPDPLPMPFSTPSNTYKTPGIVIWSLRALSDGI